MTAIQDIAYVRYGAPDLDRMQTFLEDFGLHLARRTDSALYMRGAGSAPFLHVTERTEHACALGFGLRAGSLADLEQLAVRIGASVQDNHEPGGGKVVRFADPTGLRVEMVFGQQEVAALPGRKPFPLNRIGQPQRSGAPVRVAAAPSQVMRLGHVVVHVANFSEVRDFYTSKLGFKVSDSYWAGAPDNTIAVFLHCGLGQQWTDHHTVALVAARDGLNRFDHSAFEVLDLDDLMQGNAHLAKQGHTHSWGVGRHVQGSQIFDYWRDPFGNKIEHWTDGDLVNDNNVPGHAELNPAELAQWAPPLDPKFFD